MNTVELLFAVVLLLVVGLLGQLLLYVLIPHVASGLHNPFRILYIL